MPPISSATLRSVWLYLACCFFHRTSLVPQLDQIRGLCFNFISDSSPFSETNLLWLICLPCWFLLHVSHLITFGESLADSSKLVPFQGDCCLLGCAVRWCERQQKVGQCRLDIALPCVTLLAVLRVITKQHPEVEGMFHLSGLKAIQETLQDFFPSHCSHCVIQLGMETISQTQNFFIFTVLKEV